MLSHWLPDGLAFLDFSSAYRRGKAFAWKGFRAAMQVSGAACSSFKKLSERHTFSRVPPLQLLQAPWAPLSDPSMLEATLHPRLHPVMPHSHPLPGSHGAGWGRRAPLYSGVWEQASFPVILAWQPARLTLQATDLWERRGVRLPCPASENPALWPN